MKRFERTRIWLAENGLAWTLLYQWRMMLGRLARRADARLRAREARLGLPGANPVALNLRKWDSYDWSKAGEEWTPSEEWKQALVRDVMHKYIEPGRTVLEIGPGGGRWTEFLQKLARRLVLADLSPTCIELCKKRFAGCSNIEYFVTQGNHLPFLADASMDYVWSFDVFVHIGPQDVEKYLQEFHRVLVRGGRGIIHHPREGGSPDGFRASMTAELFSDLARRAGLKVVAQLTAWGDRGQFDLERYRDVITVFEKP